MMFWHAQIENPWLNEKNRDLFFSWSSLGNGHLACGLSHVPSATWFLTQAGPLLMVQLNLTAWFMFLQRTVFSRVITEISLSRALAGEKQTSAYLTSAQLPVLGHKRIDTRLFCKLSSETLNIAAVSGSRHRCPKSARLVYCRLLQMLNPDTRVVVHDFLKKKNKTLHENASFSASLIKWFACIQTAKDLCLAKPSSSYPFPFFTGTNGEQFRNMLGIGEGGIQHVNLLLQEP